jgi:hypothetical protein
MWYSMSSRRSAGRSITTVAVGFVTLGLLACYGANTAAADQGSGDRLGCGTFCASAGQYGAAGVFAPSPVTILSSGTVTADADGYVPVTLKCNVKVQCQGALTVALSGWSNPQDSLSWITGRSDLVVDAGATRTIGVPVPAGALAFVRSQGPTALDVVADTNGMGKYLLGHADVTLAAPG